MEQHLSDMQRELQYQRLLNIADWLNFTSPQQAYAWRQTEYQQRLLMNRAEWAGYATPDQYIQYVQRDIAVQKDLNALMLARAQLYRSDTDAALGYANALSGTRFSIGQLGEGVSGTQALEAALLGLPSQVSTTLQVEDAAALAAIAAYRAVLASIPAKQDIELSYTQTRGGIPLGGTVAETIMVQVEGEEQALVDFHDLLNDLVAVSKLRTVDITAVFDDAVAQAKLAAWIAELQHAGPYINIHERVVGDGRGPPIPVPSPADIDALKALTAAEAAAGAMADADYHKFLALAAASHSAGDAYLYAQAAGVALAGAEAAAGAGADSDYAKFMALAAGAASAGDAYKYAMAASVALKAANADNGVGPATALLGQMAGRLITVGGLFGWLSTRIALFGGAASIGVIHLLIDAIIETVISLGLAAIGVAALSAAVGIFVLAADLAGDTLGRIHDRLVAVYTASTATGQAIYPMTNAFDKMASVIRPETWELYGDALDLVAGRMSLITRIAETTGAVLDRIGGRVVAYIDTPSVQKGFENLIAVGVHFAEQWGRIFLNLGTVLYHLFQAAEITHIAEDLTAFAEAVSKVLEVISRLPPWVLALGLGLHGLYIWGGLAVTAVTALLDPLRAMVLTLAGVTAGETALGTLPETASGLDRLKATVRDLGGGFGILGANMRGAGKDATAVTTTFDENGRAVTALGEDAAGAGARTGIFASALGFLVDIPIAGWIAAAVIGLGALIFAFLRTHDATQKWTTAMQDALAKTSDYKVIGQTVSDLAAATQRLAQAQQQGVGNATELATAQHLLSGELTDELVHVGGIAHAYGTDMVGALDLLNVAGVKSSQIFSNQTQVWAGAEQQVKGLVAGYAAMGQGLTQLQGDVSVQLVMNADQLAAMAKLNTAWDSWLTLVQAGPTALTTYEQSLATLVTDQKAAGASFSGTNAASLTLQSTWNQLVPQAGAVLDAVRNYTATLQDGAKGSELLTRATRDVIASSGELGTTSQGVRNSLIAVAEEANPAIDTWQKLTRWMGNQGAAQSAADLNRIMLKLQTPVSQLSADAAKFTNSLQSDLNPAMAKAEFLADGGQAAFNAFAVDLRKFGPDSQVTIDAAHRVANELIAIDGNSRAAKVQFEAWAISMGLTKAAADKLWDSINRIPTHKQFTLETDIQDTETRIGLLKKELDGATGRRAIIISLELQDAEARLHRLTGELHGVPESTVVAIQLDIGQTETRIATLKSELKTATGQRAVEISVELGDAEDKLRRLRAEEDQAKAASDRLRDGLGGAASNLGKLNAAMGQPGLWGQFEHAVLTAGDAITKAFGDVWNKILTGWDQWWDSHGGEFTTDMKQAWSTITTAASGLWDELVDAITGKGSGAGQRASDVAQTLYDLFKTAFALIKTAFDGFATAMKLAWDILVGVLSVALDLFSGNWGKAWTDMKTTAGQVFNAVADMAKEFFNNLIKPWGSGLWDNLFKPMGERFMANTVPITNYFTTTLPARLDQLGQDFSGLWGDVWNGFNRDVAGQVEHFFAADIPNWLDNVETWWDQHWKSAYASFYAVDVQPIMHFFETDIPNWLNDVEKWWDQHWKNAWNTFYAVEVQPIMHFFETDISNWLNDVEKWWDQHWKNAWNAFYNTIVQPFLHFFTGDMPNWYNDNLRWWGQLWNSAWPKFHSAIVDPMTSFFRTGLPNLIKEGTLVGIQGLARGINVPINFLNNDILKHLPGGLHIPTVPIPQSIASGGAVHMAGGSIPGTGDEDGTHIIAMGGEYMLRKPARMALQAAYGPDFLDRLNQADTLLGAGSRGSAATQMASGGPVGMPGGGYVPPLGEHEGGLASGGAIVAEAEKFLGAPYVYGGTSPSGWDCSGFVQYVLDHEGYSPPRTSEQQYAWSQHIPRSELAPGNLVFAQFPGDNSSPGHVGFFVGDNTVISAEDPYLGTGYSSLGSWGGAIVGYGKEPGPGLFGEIAGAIEGLLNAAGSALTAGAKDLAGFVEGGAAEALKLAEKGAEALFNGVWDGSIEKLVDVLPADTIPGTVGRVAAADIKTGIDNFMNQQDSTAKAAANAGGGVNVSGAGGAMAIAKRLLAAYGWSSQWPAFNSLVMDESGWNVHATNPSSGAYGIPQALPPDKMASAGPDWQNSALTQLKWMMGYIKATYGNPFTALEHEDAYHWYAAGGPVGMASGGPAAYQPKQKHWITSAEYQDLKRAGKGAYGAPGGRYTGAQGWAWLEAHHDIPTPGQAEQTQLLNMRKAFAAEETAEAALTDWRSSSLKKAHPDRYKRMLGYFSTIKGLQKSVAADEALAGTGAKTLSPSVWVTYADDLTKIRQAQNADATFIGRWGPKSLVTTAQRDLGLKYGLSGAEAKAYTEWAGLYPSTPGITGGGITTPGVLVNPPGYVMDTGVNLSPLIGGLPGSGGSFDITSGTGPAFSGGGSVADALNMFAMGGPIGQVPLDVFSSMALQAAGTSKGPGATRTLSDAALADRVGVQINGGITVNNPRPETPSDSIIRTTNRLAFTAGRPM